MLLHATKKRVGCYRECHESSKQFATFWERTTNILPTKHVYTYVEFYHELETTVQIPRFTASEIERRLKNKIAILREIMLHQILQESQLAIILGFSRLANSTIRINIDSRVSCTRFCTIVQRRPRTGALRSGISLIRYRVERANE